MQHRLSIGLCQSLTRLTRQLLEAEQQHAQTHVLAKGQIYRVTVELSPVPAEALRDVINTYQ
ncbi:hypothetical protein R6258_05645 [Halomonas sp. HP20-15]|uniref:hypothetical protein n=1 Tax=Halomonas sp. HP20-15 TaxID=3085901 RepID=UPI002981031E|nr:hypothetical protein [Halomonas sp. HP20-15]MDW5376399.1 hypothetical protein [Halomonas sp. HP20-15]